MLSMTGSTAHLAIYDTLADWEVGYLLVELRTGRFTGTPWNIVTVAEQREPITTMGGLRILPDMLLDDLDPASSDLLILPGADFWDAGDGQPFAKLPHASWTPEFQLQQSAVPPLASLELACSTLDTT